MILKLLKKVIESFLFSVFVILFMFIFISVYPIVPNQILSNKYIINNITNEKVLNITSNITIDTDFNDLREFVDTIRIKKPLDFEVRKVRWCSDYAVLSKSIGQSMKPYSWENGWYWSDDVSFSDIEVGDVITFKLNNSNKVHHSVINKYNDKLYTAGYNNNIADTYNVYPNDIISRDCIPSESN